jgi:TolA-binding protein
MTRVERPQAHAGSQAYVGSPVPADRLERQWAAIEQVGLPGMPKAGRRFRPSWAFAGFGVVTSAALAYMLAMTPAAPVPDGAMVLSAEEPIGMRLEDGSRLQLSPRSRMQMIRNEATAVELDLRSGRAHFDVTHDRSRSFHIRAGLADVSVVGTRFDVERTSQAGGSLVRVHVIEGTVEVRRRDQAQSGDELRRLHAGESWSAVLPNAVHVAPQPTKGPETSEAEADTEAQDAEPREEPETNTVAVTSGESTAHESAAHDAARVFKRASLARRAGRMRDAAEGYAELLARHPNDGRAGVAAFELGRIRMDALGDASGAIEALDRALASSSMASFHEDAMARIVVANDALGRMDACRRARDRYEARYPEGVHLRALAARCR